MTKSLLLSSFLFSCACVFASTGKSVFFKSSDGVSLHYVEAGNGEMTLVFVPGWLMPASIFEKQITDLSRDYRVLVLDPRGQGNSKAPQDKLQAADRARDIQELLSHANVRQHVLIGWSLGVMEVLDYCNRYAHLDLRALVLIDNSIGMAKPVPSSVGKSNKPMKEDEFRAYVQRFAKSMFRTTPPDGFLQRIEQSATQVPPKAAWGLLSKPYPREYYKQAVMTTNVPVWYAITPKFLEQSIELLQVRPHATFTVFENAGHALFVDNSELFNERLRQFITNLP